jgi:hypothetical protein
MQNFLLYSKPMVSILFTFTIHIVILFCQKLALAKSAKAQGSKIRAQSSPVQNSRDKKNESKDTVSIDKVHKKKISFAKKNAESSSCTLLAEGLPGKVNYTSRVCTNHQMHRCNHGTNAVYPFQAVCWVC